MGLAQDSWDYHRGEHREHRTQTVKLGVGSGVRLVSVLDVATWKFSSPGRPEQSADPDTRGQVELEETVGPVSCPGWDKGMLK